MREAMVMGDLFGTSHNSFMRNAHGHPLILTRSWHSTMPLTLVQTFDEDKRQTRREPMATGDYIQLKDWSLLEMLPLPWLK
jgi:hypothetical protein